MTVSGPLPGQLTERIGWLWVHVGSGPAPHLVPPRRARDYRTACGRRIAPGTAVRVVALPSGHCVRCVGKNGGRV